MWLTKPNIMYSQCGFKLITFKVYWFYDAVRNLLVRYVYNKLHGVKYHCR